jgi:hypothetical protein
MMLSPDQRFTLILTAIGIGVTIIIAILGFLGRYMNARFKRIAKDTTIEVNLTNALEDIATLGADLKHISEGMDKRVRWIEEKIMDS